MRILFQMTIKSTKHYEKVSCPGKWLIGLFAGMLACGMNSQLQAQDYSDLIISEYVEGSGNNKAIEIYNGTGESVSLDDYVIRIAQNGNDFNLSDNNQGLYSKLSGSLANGETYVIISNAGGSAAPNQELTDLAQLKSAAVAAMNGDDAIGLFKGETLVDVVGISEKNNKILEDVTLRRLPGFGPNTTFTMEEWEKAEKDDFSDLGSFEATPSTDPSLSLQPSSLSLKAEVDATDEGTMVVSGRNLTEDVKVALSGDDAAMFSLSAATLSAAELMADGIELTITYAPTAEGSHTATLTFSNEEVNKTATIKGSTESQQEEGSYPTLASLYDLYDTEIPTEAITIAGDVVVTHKDDYNTRIYVQDADMTNGASMLLFRAEDYGYAELQAGDVIKNLTGTMEVFNGLLEFKPTEPLTASAHDHEIHITDATVAEINADPVAYQSALLRVKNVRFEESGEFALTENGRGVNYSLLQGEDILVFRTEFADADYIGTAIPERSLDITGIMTQYNEDAQLSARSLADIVPADTTGSECEAPSNLQVECTTRPTDPYFDTYEYNAHFTWEGSASAYLFMVIQSSDTVQMDTVTDTFADITIAEVKWVITRGEWAVASICEDGSLAWSETLPFEITENQTMEAMDVRLYPNPTSGRFYLETDRDARVEVFSANGSLIESFDLNAGLNEMNLRQKGVYFVRVSNGKASTVKRVVVR